MAVTDDRKQAFIDALRRCMAERGYEGATVGAVARDAGLTPGLMHYYFPSKQALLLALLDDLAAHLQRRLGQASAEAAATPEQRVRQVVHAALAVGDGSDPAAVRCWVHAGAEALRQDAVREVWSAHMQTLTAALAKDLAQAGSPEPAADAAAVVSAILGAWQLGTAAPGIVPPGTSATAVDRLIDGLLPRRSP